MTKPKEVLDGKAAYDQALADLGQPNCTPLELKRLFPDRYFRYSEEGYGLKLPGRFAYVSGPYTEEIRGYKGRMRIRHDWTNDLEWTHYNRELPVEKGREVVLFARRAKAKCENSQKVKQLKFP